MLGVVLGQRRLNLITYNYHLGDVVQLAETLKGTGSSFPPRWAARRFSPRAHAQSCSSR